MPSRTVPRNPFRRHASGGVVARAVPAEGSFDAIVLGATPHGLALARELSRFRRMRRIAVLDDGLAGPDDVAPAAFLPDLATPPTLIPLFAGLPRRLTPGHGPVLRRQALAVARDDATLRDLTVLAGRCEQAGLKAVLLDAAGVARTCPLIPPFANPRAAPVRGGLFLRDAVSVESHALVEAQIAAAAGHGISVYQQTRITGFRQTDGRIDGVETAAGPVTAPLVVLCRIRGARRLLAPLGLEPRLKRVPTDILLTQQAAPTGTPILHEAGAGFTLLQDRSGRLVARAPAARSDDPYSPVEARMALAECLLGLLPRAGSLSVAAYRRTDSMIGADGLPIVGYAGVEGLWYDMGWRDEGAWAVGAVAPALARAIRRNEMTPALLPLAPVRPGLPEAPTSRGPHPDLAGRSDPAAA